MTKRIVVFGFVPLANKIVWDLYARKDVHLIGVVKKEREMPNWRLGRSKQPVHDTCEELNIPLLDKDEVINLSPDFGFTVSYPDILSEEILDAFSRGIINLHHGYLPEYRGVHISNHVLLNKEAWHGTTIHFLDSEVDEGEIIRRGKFPVESKDTSYTLHKKAILHNWKLYINSIDDILADDIETTPQKEFQPERDPKTYTRTDINGEKRVDLNNNYDDIISRIRAFDFPSHEPAYTLIGNTKIHLRTGWNSEWPTEYNLP